MYYHFYRFAIKDSLAMLLSGTTEEFIQAKNLISKYPYSTKSFGYQMATECRSYDQPNSRRRPTEGKLAVSRSPTDFRLVVRPTFGSHLIAKRFVLYKYLFTCRWIKQFMNYFSPKKRCNRCQSAFSQAAHLKNHEKVSNSVVLSLKVFLNKNILSRFIPALNHSNATFVLPHSLIALHWRGIATSTRNMVNIEIKNWKF